MPPKCANCTAGIPCNAPALLLRALVKSGHMRVLVPDLSREAAAEPPDERDAEASAPAETVVAPPNERKRKRGDEAEKRVARVLEGFDIAPCGTCVYWPGEERDECSVCLELRCKGNRGGSVCNECILSKPHDELFPGTDEHGRRLDPETRRPLLTCKCGKVIWNTSSCILLGLAGDPAHSPIADSRPDEE